MKEKIKESLRDSKKARWFALGVVAFTMLCGYFITDAMNPLKPMLETQLGWNSSEFGIYAGAYGWFNVFLLMLIFGGIVLDKMGVRFTGLGAAILMIVGTGINYYAISPFFPQSYANVVVNLIFFELRLPVLIACLGFAIFGVGAEVAGITVSRIIVKWFKGKELALAMGLEMATARMGTLLAMAIPLPLADYLGGVSKPILCGLILLCIGLISFIIYCIQDKKLEAEGIEDGEEEEPFKVSDIKEIVTNGGFWLLALLCVLFYSAIFPWIKFSIDLMINKYQVDPSYAGLIPAFLPMGCLVLTPLFGSIYDHKGKGATIMIIGSLMLILVHVIFSLPINNMWIALITTIVLGITLSLLPSAMWPSVPKIIPERLLGTAYALTFWVQNWGLMLVPTIIGLVLNVTNKDVLPVKEYVKHSVEQVCKVHGDALEVNTQNQVKFKENVETITNNIINYILVNAKYEQQKDFKISPDDNSLQIVMNKAIKDGVSDFNIEYRQKRENDNQITLSKCVLNRLKSAALNYSQEKKLPLRYDYQVPNLIFCLFGILALIIALLLKRRDRIYKYGLEEPNIQS